MYIINLQIYMILSSSFFYNAKNNPAFIVSKTDLYFWINNAIFALLS
jgi:hypothetical protein